MKNFTGFIKKKEKPITELMMAMLIAQDVYTGTSMVDGAMLVLEEVRRHELKKEMNKSE